MPAMELLERLRTSGYREPVEVFEREPPRELVASADVVRTDALGRNVVVVPMGTVPDHWVKLTDQERAALVEPPPRPPAGYLHPGPYGFSPEGVVMSGFTIETP